MIRLKHSLLWLRLSRGTLFDHSGRLREAALVFEDAFRDAASFESECQGDGAGCFGRELLSSCIALAEVRASQGRFNESIKLLAKVQKLIPRENHSHFGSFDENIASLIDRFGSALGYTKLSLKLAYEYEGEKFDSGRREDEVWRFPVPLAGPTYADFSMKYQAIQGDLQSSAQNSLEDRESNQRKLLTVLHGWRKATPYSATVSNELVSSLFNLAILEIKLNKIDLFLDSWSKINEEIIKLENQAPECVDLYRTLGISFYRLGVAIVDHKFDDVSTFQRMSKVSTVCAYDGMTLFQEARQASEVTQAIGLCACELMNLQAINSEQFGNTKLANHSRNQRDAVLVHILRLDPNNDRGNSLLKKYGRPKKWVNPSISKEVTSWNWSIVPIV